MIKATLIKIIALAVFVAISYHGCDIYDKFSQQQTEITKLSQQLNDVNVKLLDLQENNLDQIKSTQQQSALTGDLIIKLQEQEQLVNDLAVKSSKKK